MLSFRFRIAAAAIGLVVLASAPRAQAADGSPAADDGSSPAARSWWRTALSSSRDFVGRLNDEGVFPQVKSFADNTGPAPGVVFWKPRLGGTPFSLYASYAHSFRGDELREVRFGRVPDNGRRPPRRSDYELLSPTEMSHDGAFYYVTVRQRDLSTSELFVPSAGGAGATIHYRNVEDLYEAIAGYRFSPRLSAAVRVGLLSNEVGPGDDPLPGLVADRGAASASSALTAKPDYFRTAAVLAFDDRDVPRNTHAGTFASLTLARYADRAQGAFTFDRVTLDARRYQPLGSTRHVLAARLLTSQSFAGPGAHVPFYLQDTLGGNFTMRSYPSYRFRGDKVLTLSAEYRFELTPRYELAALYDTGKAWDDNAFSLKGMKSSYGLGFRIKATDAARIRLEVARGSEGTRALLKLGYSF